MNSLADMDDGQFAREIKAMRLYGSDSQFFEVKACKRELTKDIGKTISAFANGPGGMIVLGLDESRGFIPVSGFDAMRMRDALAQYCADKLNPRIVPIVEIRMFEGAQVVTAFIPELRPKDKPCFVAASGRYGGSYVRIGDGDRRLSSYEVDRLMEEHEQPRYDGRIVPDATLDDLDSQLVQGLLTRERQAHARLSRLDDLTVLRMLHVVQADDDGVDRPTLAGLLALGTYPQQFYPRLNVSFSCYPGLTKAEVASDGLRFLDFVTCTGPIPDMVNDAVAAVRKNMRVGGRIEGALRHDVPDYPLVAVREAVVNALMHRDYSPEALGSAVMVDMYADRLEVSNVGGLYGAVTLDTLVSGPIGSARNQWLASILESTPMSGGEFVAENRGTGYFVICQAMRDAGLPDPVPRDSISSFSLTLQCGRAKKGDVGEGSGRHGEGEAPKRGVAQPVAKLDAVADFGSASVEGDSAAVNGVVERVVVGLEKRSPASGPQGKDGLSDSPFWVNDLETWILETVTERGSATTSELVQESRRSRPTVLKALRRLTEYGFVVPTEAKNSPHQRYRPSGTYRLAR